MILVTCQNPECANPPFFVNIKSGKFPLALAPDSPDLTTDINPAAITPKMNAVINSESFRAELNDLKDTEKNKFSEVISKSKLLNILNSFSKKKFKVEDDVKDYLIVFCECGYRSHIPLTEDKKVYEKYLETNNQ